MKNNHLRSDYTLATIYRPPHIHTISIGSHVAVRAIAQSGTVTLIEAQHSLLSFKMRFQSLLQLVVTMFAVGTLSVPVNVAERGLTAEEIENKISVEKKWLGDIE